MGLDDDAKTTGFNCEVQGFPVHNFKGYKMRIFFGSVEDNQHLDVVNL